MSVAPPISTTLAQPIMYPRLYPWYVLLAALDVVFTTIILLSGGTEINALANWILGQYGLLGLVVFKFAVVAFVLVICEIVGHREPRLGKRLAEWAIAINAIPVTVATAQLALVTWTLAA